jgi:hypothetical protein
MSALRSKLFSSAFDDAMSKPLIRTEPLNNNNSSNDYKNRTSQLSPQKDQDDIENNISTVMNSNQISEKSQPYSPPAPLLQTEYQLHDDEADSSSRIDLLILRERHEETQQIHSNMSTIREINTTLAQLVNSQQHDIDLIEENAIDIHENTTEALTMLEKANKLLKDGMGMEEGIMRMFFLVFAVGGTAIGVVMFFEAIL